MDLQGLLTYADQSLDPVRSMAVGKDGARRRLGEIMIGAGILSDAQLRIALQRWNLSSHRHLGEILLELGFVDEETLARALAAQVQVPYIALDAIAISGTAVGLVNKRLISFHRAIPIYHTETTLVVAMADPFNIVAIDDFARVTGLRVKPVVSTRSGIDAAVAKCYRAH